MIDRWNKVHFVELVELYKKLFVSTQDRHWLHLPEINELLEYFANNFFILRAREVVQESNL